MKTMITNLTKSIMSSPIWVVALLMVSVSYAQPYITQLTPANGSICVNTSNNLILKFNTPVIAGTGKSLYIYRADGTLEEQIITSSGLVTGIGSVTITVNPSNDLNYNTSYYILADTGAFKAFFGGANWVGISDSTTWTFKIGGPYYLVDDSTQTNFVAGSSTTLTFLITDSCGNTLSDNITQGTLTVNGSATIATNPVLASNGILTFVISDTVVETLNFSLSTFPTLNGPGGIQSVDVLPAAAHHITLTSSVSNVTVGDTINIAFQIKDIYENLNNNFTGTLNLNVTEDSADGTRQILTPNPATVVGGQASFQVKDTVDDRLCFTVTSSPSLISPSIPCAIVSPGAATQLKITQAPSNFVLGDSTQMKFGIADAYGNILYANNSALTMLTISESIANSSAIVTPNAVQSANNGQITYTVSDNQPETLSFSIVSVPSLNLPTIPSIQVILGPTDSLFISSQPMNFATCNYTTITVQAVSSNNFNTADNSTQVMLIVTQSLPNASVTVTPNPITLVGGVGTFTVSDTQAESLSFTMQSVPTVGYDTITSVNVIAATPVELGTSGSICDSIQLDAGGGFVTYNWSTGDTIQSILVTNTGSYSLTVTDVYGCTSIDIINFFVTSSPSPDLGNDTADCGSITIGGTLSFPSYAWNTGQSTQTIVVDTAGTYIVTVTSNGCSGSDTIVVTPYPIPGVNLGNDTTLCDSLTLSAGLGFANYTWSNGATTPSITIGSTNNYAVTVTDVNNCVVEDDISVIITSIIPVNLGPDTSFCASGTVGIGYNPAYQYLWTTGDTTSTIVVTSSAMYYISVTDGSGCASIDNLVVVINANPITDLGANQTICPNSTVTIQADSGFVSYSWSDGSTNNNITINNAGTYSVTVTDNSGCSGNDSVSVSLYPTPVVNITGEVDTLVMGDSTLLTANPGFVSYLWNDSSTAESLMATNANYGSSTFSVTVIDSNGCSDADNVAIFFKYPVGINENNPQQLMVQLYPNPSNGFVNLTVKGTSSAVSVSVMTLLGEEIYKINFTDFINNYVLNLTGNAAGFYFVEVKTTQGIVRTKLVIK